MGFLNIGNSNMMRVLIEGGYKNGFNNHYLDREEFYLSDDVKTLEIGDFYLDLTARINKVGGVEHFVNISGDKPFELEYNSSFEINLPKLVIVEDGRVYCLRGLTENDEGRDYLESMLERISGEWDEGKGFDETYSEGDYL